ncbi:MAG: enoyl-CoA hydratase/isomerase family protein, partial [Pseudomonadales bacterium]|nr:enoyl-CoA hydratase/isomerase family protein [Pseudomonadales bacterium]
DPDIGAIILTGAGRGFCAGGDVKGMAARNDGDGKGDRRPPSLEQRANDLRASMEISKMLHTMPKPTIAMMRGPAAGAGLAMALACDIRIASDTLKVTTAFARVGFSGDFGGSYFLTRIVGTAKARELYFTAEQLDANSAIQLGMVNHVVADPELESKTMEMALKIANGPRVAYEYMKKNLNAAESGTLDQVLDMEAWHMTRTGFTEDHREAAMAFVEKREPSFKGR